MRLSEHFELEEFTYSDTAKKKHICNNPTAIHLKVLQHTCQYFFEPLRKLFNEHYGKASITITSGYRGCALNKAVGGVCSSQHCNGEAGDFDVYKYVNGKKVKVPYTETYALIKKWVKEGRISVDQCICEQCGSATWVHCSYKAAGATVNRKQFLLYKGGKYIND